MTLFSLVHQVSHFDFTIAKYEVMTSSRLDEHELKEILIISGIRQFKKINKGHNKRAIDWLLGRQQFCLTHEGLQLQETDPSWGQRKLLLFSNPVHKFTID